MKATQHPSEANLLVRVLQAGAVIMQETSFHYIRGVAGMSGVVQNEKTNAKKGQTPIFYFSGFCTREEQ